MKRLVSAIYQEFHPFDSLPGISECGVADHPDDLTKDDILIIHGGQDISPSLYGKGRSSLTWATQKPSRRDEVEWALMTRAQELGVPIIGICRGAQLLCAKAGGFLIQHVNGHQGAHTITTKEGLIFRVNSIHHQMMQPQGTNHELVAWATDKQSDVYFDVDEKVDVEVEPEMVYFPDLKGFAFQWHPEGLPLAAPPQRYILDYIKEKLNA